MTSARSVLGARLRDPLWLVTGALFVAVCIRGAVFAAIPPEAMHAPYQGDFVHYDEIARNLLDGRGFLLRGQPNVLRAPGYPVWLAGVYAVFGRNHAAVLAIQIILGILTIGLAAILSRRFAGDRAGIITAWIAALNPVLIRYNVRPLSEPLYTAILILAALVLVPAMGEPRYRRAAMGGALIALACLVRPVSLLLPAFLGVWWLWRLGIRKGAEMSAICVTTFAVVLAPWTIRNAVVTGRFIPVNLQSGITLLAANNEMTLYDPMYRGYNYFPDGQTVATPWDPVAKQIEGDTIHRGYALRFLTEHWRDIPRLVAYKMARFLGIITNARPLERLFIYLVDLPLIPLAAIGLAIALRRGQIGVLAPAFIIATALVGVAIFWGDSRFRYTITPFTVALAAIPFVALRDIISRRRTVSSP